MKEKTKTETLITFGKSLIPIFGYYSARSEAFKDGIAAVSEEYAKKLAESNACSRQIRKELLGECAAFICPNGWDAEYWQNLVRTFADKNPDPGKDAKTILESFIAQCLATFPVDRHLGETRRELGIILQVLQSEPRKRLDFDKESLEFAIDFLDLFHDFPDKDNCGYVSQLLRIRDELLAALDKSEGCNFLILGKTGSGKSALLNYILGSDVAESGAGRPVTERGLHEKTGVVNGVKVKVYDSWGLEAGHYDEWLQMMDAEKNKHDLNHKITDWFHVVVHCVQASGARVEDVDAKIVNGFLKDGFKVLVALTKVDTCSEEDEEALKDTLVEMCPGLAREAIISVCSVEKVIRGVTHERMGGDALKRAIIGGFVGTIVRRLPLRVSLLANREVDKFYEDTKAWIAGRSMWSSDNTEWLKDKCESFVLKLNKVKLPAIIKEELLACATISQSLSATINVENDYFKKLSSGSFYDPDQPWYLDVAQTIFTAVVLPFAAVWYFLAGGGSDQEREALTGRLDKFVSEVRTKIKDGESEIATQIRNVLNYKE